MALQRVTARDERLGRRTADFAGAKVALNVAAQDISIGRSVLKRLVSAQRARASRVARTAMTPRRREINHIPYRRWKSSRALEMFQKMLALFHTVFYDYLV